MSFWEEYVSGNKSKGEFCCETEKNKKKVDKKDNIQSGTKG